jgi:hypothetical protein
MNDMEKKIEEARKKANCEFEYMHMVALIKVQFNGGK